MLQFKLHLNRRHLQLIERHTRAKAWILPLVSVLLISLLFMSDSYANQRVLSPGGTAILDRADFENPTSTGASRNVDSLSALSSVISDSSINHFILSGIFEPTSNLVITKILQPLPGGMIKPASGITVTITKLAYEPGPYQWIDTSAGGSVVIHSEKRLPQWWGAAGDGITDDTKAIQAAINSIPQYGGSIIDFYPTTSGYAVKNLTLPTDRYVHLKGIGSTRVGSNRGRAVTSCILQIAASKGPVIQVGPKSGGTYMGTLIEGLQIKGCATGGDLINIAHRTRGVTVRDCWLENHPSNTTGSCIYGDASLYLKVENVWIGGGREVRHTFDVLCAWRSCFTGLSSEHPKLRYSCIEYLHGPRDLG